MDKVPKVRAHIESDALSSSRKQAGMYRKHEHKDEEYEHHHLCYLLYAVLESDDYDSCCKKQGQSHHRNLQSWCGCKG